MDGDGNGIPCETPPLAHDDSVVQLPETLLLNGPHAEMSTLLCPDAMHRMAPLRAD
ncbi:hypothetical protein J8I82_21250 [Cupriavidus sp. LEh25]|nr:hypothetical protein [Cupriavidus sp. LEh25]